jgi:hypothetical protein
MFLICPLCVILNDKTTSNRVRAIALAMGMRPVMWTRGLSGTFDTGDFNIQSGTVSTSQVLQNWQFILGNATKSNRGFIVLEHDLFQQAVDVATGYILPDALARQNPPFKIMPVVNCLGKPLTDAYVETNNNATSPPVTTFDTVVIHSATPTVPQTPTSTSSNSGANRGALLTVSTTTVMVAMTIGIALASSLLLLFS